MRHQQQRKQKRGAQRSQVIEGEHVRHQVAQVETVFENPHQQRNLQAHQDADGDHQQIQHQPEALGIGEGQKQHGGREPAHQPDHQFDGDETAHQAPYQVARQETANPHREQVAADDGGKLKYAVAEQIAGESACDQLIDEAAGGDEEDGKKKNYSHTGDSFNGPANRAGISGILSRRWRGRGRLLQNANPLRLGHVPQFPIHR